MFWRICWRAWRVTWGRTLLALLSVAIGAGTFATVAILRADVRQKMMGELAAYGPNLVVTPPGGATTIATMAGELPSMQAEAPAFTVEQADALQSLLGRVERFRNGSGWHPGPLIPSGSSVVEARIEGEPGVVDTVAASIQSALPGVVARPVRQLTEGDGRFLTRLSGLMLGMTLVVLVAAGLSMLSSLLAIVYERRTETALLLALGAGRGRISALFLVELGGLAGVGGLIGGGVGYGVADLLARDLFQSPVGWRVEVIPLVLAMSLLLTLAAGWIPLRRLLDVQPAVVLRGE